MSTRDIADVREECDIKVEIKTEADEFSDSGHPGDDSLMEQEPEFFSLLLHPPISNNNFICEDQADNVSSVCSKSYNRRQALTTHLRSEHSVNKQNNNDSNSSAVATSTTMGQSERVSMFPSKKRSLVWCYFTDQGDGKARCELCQYELSFRGGSPNNLKRHLDWKHPTIDVKQRKQVNLDLNLHSSSYGSTNNIQASRYLPVNQIPASSLISQVSESSVISQTSLSVTTNLLSCSSVISQPSQTSKINQPSQSSVTNQPSQSVTNQPSQSSVTDKPLAQSATHQLKGSKVTNQILTSSLTNQVLGFSVNNQQPEHSLPSTEEASHQQSVPCMTTGEFENNQPDNTLSEMMSNADPIQSNSQSKLERAEGSSSLCQTSSTCSSANHMISNSSTAIHATSLPSISVLPLSPPSTVSTSMVSTSMVSSSVISTSTVSSSMISNSAASTSTVSTSTVSSFTASNSVLSCSVTHNSGARVKDAKRAMIGFMAMEMHSISSISKPGFKYLMEFAVPGYRLQESTLNRLLAKTYRRLCSDIKQELEQVQYVCLTTDKWSSQNYGCYLSVSAHYVNEDFVLKSAMIDCFHTPCKPNAAYIKMDLDDTFADWKIKGKVMCFVTTDSYVKVGIESHPYFPHLSCFAHTINAIGLEAVKCIESAQNRVREVVEYFTHDSHARDYLEVEIRRKNIDDSDVVMDSPTRWNSTVEMLQRLCEIKEPICGTLDFIRVSSLNKDEIPTVGESNWKIIAEACELLQPLYEVTEEIQSEKIVMVSKVIVILKGLKHLCLEYLRKAGISDEVRQMAQNLQNSINERFKDFEESDLVSEAMLLDPRFKKAGFSEPCDVDDVVADIIDRMSQPADSALSSDTEDTAVSNNDGPQSTLVMQENVSEPTASVWSWFEVQLSGMNSQSNPHREAEVELQHYLTQPLIPRTSDPLAWWRSKSLLYPKLAEFVKSRLCIVATAVPSDRVFSESGELFCERRARLSRDELCKMVFLNANMNR